MSDDTISRQAAIDAICTEGTRLERNGTVAMAEIKQWCVDILEALPSAQPEQKKGKWNHGLCNVCGYDWGKDAPIANVPPFCPNCGADMRGEQE